MILAFFISMFSDAGSKWWAIFGNINFVISFILGVCGLSFVDFMLGKKISKTFLRVLIYFGAAITGSMLLPIIIEVLIIIAILDSGRDFRKLRDVEE